MGFCQGEKEAVDGCITFVYNSQARVDEEFERRKDIATTEPVLNTKFGLYHFWGKILRAERLNFSVFLMSI
jgi:hypothetical protein